MTTLRFAALVAVAVTCAACTARFGMSATAGGAAPRFTTEGGEAAGLAVGAPAQATASATVRVSFFGVPLDGAQDVVFVIDRSGSMQGVATGFSAQQLGMDDTTATLAELGSEVAGPALGNPVQTKIDAAKAELVRALESLPDGTRVDVVFFDDEVSALWPLVRPLDASSRAEAIAFVREVRPGGSTAAVPALHAAYGYGARRVVLLSDGLANTGGDGATLLADARVEMHEGIRFDTVGVGLDQDATLMETLARESGGVCVTR